MPISSRIDIIGENAGLHLLLRVNGGLKEQDLLLRAEKYGVRLYGLSSYYSKPVNYMPDNIVIAGYSNFSEEEIEEAVKLLNQAWS